jgi:hypothetical protein
MKRIPIGWGPEVLSAHHYARTYRDDSELTELTVQCVTSGLLNNEMVLYSVLPDGLTTFIGRLETEVPDLMQRVAAGQLQQKVNAQAVNTWLFGGIKAMRQLVQHLCAEASSRGFHGVRWVGQAYLNSAQPTALMEWCAMQDSLAVAVRETREIPVTTVYLYRHGELGDMVARSYVIVDV